MIKTDFSRLLKNGKKIWKDVKFCRNILDYVHSYIYQSKTRVIILSFTFSENYFFVHPVFTQSNSWSYLILQQLIECTPSPNQLWTLIKIRNLLLPKFNIGIYVKIYATQVLAKTHFNDLCNVVKSRVVLQTLSPRHLMCINTH